MTAPRSSATSGGRGPAGRWLATIALSGCFFWAGFGVGLIVQEYRPFGTDYWRENAHQAWNLRKDSTAARRERKTP